jgi:hypothetical protein
MSPRTIAAAATLFLSAVTASSASAQVYYEPVQYQHSAGGRAYYYGGTDPGVHYRATLNSRDPNFGRSNSYAFHSHRLDTHREVVTEPERIYLDSVPYHNARFFGASVDDARNAAYANAATYFRKADLRHVARVQADGTWSVPATAGTRGTIEIRPVVQPPVVRPVVTPKPVLIIPKHLLDKKLWGEKPLTADAR